VILDLRAKTRDEARTATALAMRRVEDAKQAQTERELAWTRRADEVVKPVATSAAEFAEARSYLAYMRKAADAAQAALDDALATESSERQELLHAETEVKKIESWIDAALTEERAEETRRERVTTDELAARRFGVRR
jgi:flagellar export protein FliJ